MRRHIASRFARGTDASGLQGEFRISIRYREPTYADGAKLFLHTVVVQADNAERAQAMAVAEFQELARASSVSYTRSITDVQVVD